MSNVRVSGWYLEQKIPAKNAFKQYTVLIGEDGTLVLAWGRIGQAGQKQIHRLPFPTAESQGKSKMYTKQSTGYEVVQDEFVFTIDSEVLDEACRRDMADPVIRAFHDARRDPAYTGEQKSVVKHYDDFVAKAQRLLQEAGKRPFESVLGEFEELGDAWKAISEAHDAAAITIDLVKQTLNQRIMSGAL